MITLNKEEVKLLALKWQSEIDERLFNAMMKWSVKDE